MRNGFFIYILILSGFLILLPPSGSDRAGVTHVLESEPALAKPDLNIVLITISSLRADHTGLFGYFRNTTPHLDKFAARNIIFTHAFATSGWMMPAHASILTGLYPKNHGVTHIRESLKSHFVTLPEILIQHEYRCAGFCCNPRLSSERGFGQGFDLYDDFSVQMVLESLNFNEQELNVNTRRTNSLINDAAIRWLQMNMHSPFFLFVHYYDNHWDYLPPAPYNKIYDPNYWGDITGYGIAREPLFSNPPADRDRKHIIALYDGEIRQTDQDLAKLLGYLEESGLAENSLIVVMADHGEQFYEHGHTSHLGIYEELIHIPLVLAIPQKQVEPKEIPILVSQVDIMPTLLDYAGIAPPPTCDGKSLKPLIDNRADKRNDYLFSEYSAGVVAKMTAIRSQHHKIYEIAGQRPYAYDLALDPTEQKKIVFDQFDEQMNQLYNVLQDWLAR